MVDEFQDTNPRQLGDPRGARARQPVHGRRRVPVDLRVPRRRGGAVPRPSRGARRARAQPRADGATSAASRPLLEVVNAVFADRFSGFSSAPRGPRRRSSSREPIVELLLTAKSGWEEDQELAAEIAARPAAGPALAPGRGAPARPARGRARGQRQRACRRRRGAAARRRRPRGLRARAAAARPAHAGGGRAASGRTSRSATCWPICARSPTRWTSRRSTARSPRRSWASRATASRCSPRPPSGAARGVWETTSQRRARSGLLDELSERDRERSARVPRAP